MIEGHGDDLYKYHNSIRHNFSSNIFARVDHSGLLQHLAERGNDILHYPEPRCLSLERKLAQEAGIDPGKVLVTSGATECIYLIAQMIRGGKATIVAPAFREYEDACQLNSITVEWCRSLSEAMATDSDAVWICNPANPTGGVIPAEQLEAAIQSSPNTLFVVDQAYADYTSMQVLSPSLAERFNNLILLSSLTKQFAVPGLRIGYAIGCVDRVAQYLRPWSVSSIAIIAAHYLLEHKEDYAIDAALLHNEALRMSVEFEKLGIKVFPTDCNFILCSLPHGSAAQLKQWLVENHGILIRDASNFHFLDQSHFRVAAQTPEENNLLIKALEQWRSA